VSNIGASESAANAWLKFIVAEEEKGQAVKDCGCHGVSDLFARQRKRKEALKVLNLKFTVSAEKTKMGQIENSADVPAG